MQYHLTVFTGTEGAPNCLMHFNVQAPTIERAREVLYAALEETQFEAIAPGELPAGVTLKYLSFVLTPGDIKYAGHEEIYTAGDEPIGRTQGPRAKHDPSPAAAQALYATVLEVQPDEVPNADPRFTIADWNLLKHAALFVLATPTPHNLDNAAVQIARRIRELDTAGATPIHGMWNNMRLRANAELQVLTPQAGG